MMMEEAPFREYGAERESPISMEEVEFLQSVLRAPEDAVRGLLLSHAQISVGKYVRS